MSSTFSTVINFGMLGLLRRLHRMQIQISLEAETEKTGIHFPHCEKHAKKHNSATSSVNLSSLSIEDIEQKVMQGKMRPQEMIEKLNMKDLEKYWENPPIPAEETICESEEDSDEESDEDICEEDNNEGDSEGDSLSTEKTINEMIYK